MKSFKQYLLENELTPQGTENSSPENSSPENSSPVHLAYYGDDEAPKGTLITKNHIADLITKKPIEIHSYLADRDGFGRPAGELVINIHEPLPPKPYGELEKDGERGKLLHRHILRDPNAFVAGSDNGVVGFSRNQLSEKDVSRLIREHLKGEMPNSILSDPWEKGTVGAQHGVSPE